jgi:hypothetical protein
MNVTQGQTSLPPSPDLALFTGPAGNPGTISAAGRGHRPVDRHGRRQPDAGLHQQRRGHGHGRVRYAPDCNDNDVPDDTDIANGTSQDCDGNEVPDECQPDCNQDGTPDACEADCDHDGTPDECDKTPARVPGDQPPHARQPAPVPRVRQPRAGRSRWSRSPTSTATCLTGSVDVEFVYIGRFGPNHVDLPCLETNRTRHLTPCDTLTLWTKADNPNAAQGYLYVFAKNAAGKAIVFNHLIGEELFLSPTDALDDSVSALVFHGSAPRAARPTTTRTTSATSTDWSTTRPRPSC